MNRRAVAPAVAVALAIAYVVVPESVWSELLLYNASVVISLAMAVVGWRRSVGSARRFPACVALALGAFVVGELIWWWFTWRGIDPYPSVADGFYLLGYVPLALAGAVLAGEGRRVRDRSALLDAFGLTAVAGLIFWNLLMESYVGDEGMSAFETAVALAYPLADLAVLAFVLVFLLSRATRDRRSSLFVVGVIATLTADVLFTYQELQGTFVSAAAVDLAWGIGYVLIGTSASTPRDTDRRPADDVDFGAHRLVYALIAVLVPQAVIVMELRDRGLFELGTLTVAIGVAVVTGVLVALRMFGLLGRARAVEQRKGAERLASVIHHSTDAIFLIDRLHRVTFASPAVEELTGRRPEAIVGADLATFFVDASGVVRRKLSDLAPQANGAVVHLDGRFAHRDGTIRMVEGTVCNLLGDHDVESFVVTLRDVSVRHELEAQLERRAFHDELTGLANRALFSDRVTHAIERVGRHPEAGLAVAFIDLDDFKAVNDGMGHSVGDELLQKVAERLQSCLRPADTIARFGGDEFAVLLEDVASPQEARELAERVVEVLRLPMDVDELSLGVPASVGVAFAVADSTNESLMRDADTAMYSAKSKGKGCVVVFDDTMRDIARERLSLKVELAHALADDQFEVVYQSIHDIGDSDSLQGFEALVRWHHPTRGEIAPLDFIPLAEETGDIVEIGGWVLEEACRRAASWNGRFGLELMMSVNVSAVQLYQPGFVDDVRRVLAVSGLEGRLLTLEITESVLVDQERAESILVDLRTLGVGIAIDDFGTGYSSLSYLRRFPVTSVKIDRSFVTDLALERDDALVRSIVSIADALGLSTVAEGVETVAQLDQLLAIDCRLAQGYYLGRPRRRDLVDELLSTMGGEPAAAQREAVAEPAS